MGANPSGVRKKARAKRRKRENERLAKKACETVSDARNQDSKPVVEVTIR